MNGSPYLISGRKRQRLKRLRSRLESQIDNFWHYEGMEQLMGIDTPKEESELRLKYLNTRLDILERALKQTKDA